MEFRFHSGSFAESMASVIEIRNYAHLKKLIEEKYPMKVRSIHFEWMGIDRRNHWSTYMVKANFEGVTPGLPVGWSNAEKFD